LAVKSELLQSPPTVRVRQVHLVLCATIVGVIIPSAQTDFKESHILTTGKGDYDGKTRDH
jgi:hypothetical protein